jgi:hypothetical protein
MSKVKFTEKELINFIEDIVETTEPKDESTILSEARHNRLVTWADRFERKNINKSPDIIFENFIKEIHNLQRNGITTTELSESLKKNKKYILEQQSFTMSQNQGILGSLWGTVREKFWAWLLRTFGIEGELARFVGISLGNIPIWDIPKLLNCNYLAPFLTKGLIEYGAHKLGKATMGLDGTFEQVLRNSLTDIGDNSPIYIEIEGKVKEVLCGALGEKKEQVQNILNKEKEDDAGAKTTTTPSNGKSDTASGDMLIDLAKKYAEKFAQNLGR